MSVPLRLCQSTRTGLPLKGSIVTIQGLETRCEPPRSREAKTSLRQSGTQSPTPTSHPKSVSLISSLGPSDTRRRYRSSVLPAARKLLYYFSRMFINPAFSNA